MTMIMALMMIVDDNYDENDDDGDASDVMTLIISAFSNTSSFI